MCVISAADETMIELFSGLSARQSPGCSASSVRRAPTLRSKDAPGTSPSKTECCWSPFTGAPPGAEIVGLQTGGDNVDDGRAGLPAAQCGDGRASSRSDNEVCFALVCLRLWSLRVLEVRAGGDEEVPLAWGWVGWLPVRVGCCCRAWGWARTRWGFELGGVARRRAGGAPFPPRPGDCPGAGTLRTADRPDPSALRVWVVWAARVRVPSRWARLGSLRPLPALRSVLGIELSRLS